jgi:hypothetical protein
LFLQAKSSPTGKHQWRSQVIISSLLTLATNGTIGEGGEAPEEAE